MERDLRPDLTSAQQTAQGMGLLLNPDRKESGRPCRKNQSLLITMNYSDKATDELMKHYRATFGVCIRFEDAIRMMLLIKMLTEVFEKYETEEDIVSFIAPLLGL